MRLCEHYLKYLRLSIELTTQGAGKQEEAGLVYMLPRRYYINMEVNVRFVIRNPG